jgi:hypothetical protein
MKRMIVSFLILTAPALAMADEHVKDDGSKDLSKIDGQLVPVGTHTDYHYQNFPRLNLSTNPLGYIYGDYGVSLGYGLTENIAVRLDVDYWSPPGGSDNWMQFGVAAPLYLRRTWLGVFLEPGIILRTASTYQDETVGPQMLIGYHWTFDSGLNFAIAAGVGRNLTSGHTDELFPAGYLRFGYAF